MFSEGSSMSFKSDKAAICWDMDPSEAFLVGTKEELRKLAEDILLAIESDTIDGIIGDTQLKFSSSDNSLTENGLDIVVNNIAIVKDNKDTSKIINSLRELNGMSPLADE
jgi:hypothetical protein